MRRLRSCLFLPAILLAFSAGTAGAQGTGDTAARPPSPAGTLFLELFVPTAGYAYAGEWKRGVPLGVVRLGAFAVMMGSSGLGSSPCEGGCAVANGVALGATAWAVVDAVRIAQRKYKAHHEARPLMLLRPAEHGGMDVGLRWSFR